MGPEANDITELLSQANAGDRQAWDRLMARVYTDLRRLAHRQLAGQPRDQTLDTTGLVHECWLRLVGRGGSAHDRNHFYALSSRVMRQVIVDGARAHLAEKRGGAARRIALEDLGEEELQEAERLVALDDALSELIRARPRQARVVECRFFAGLSEQETAEAIGVSLRQVQADWHAGRHWLARFLKP